MANYINLRNDSRELLNIELVPKNQASTIRFKNNPPLNHQVDEQGVVRFALATDKIDRGAIAAGNRNHEMIITKVNGVEHSPMYLTVANWSPEKPLLTAHTLAQLGISTVTTVTESMYQEEANRYTNYVFYNNLPNQTVVLEGYAQDVENGTPVKILTTPNNAIFNDPDLASASIMADDEGNFGIALGVSDKPFGSEINWYPPIHDPDNSLLTGNIHLSLSVVIPGMDPIRLSHTATVTRENTDEQWWDNHNLSEANLEFIDAFNTQFSEATGYPVPLFANQREVSSGALYLFAIDYDEPDYPNAFFPMELRDTIDGTWFDMGDGPVVKEPVYNEPAMMSVTSDSMEDGSMYDGSMEDGSMEGGSMEDGSMEQPDGLIVPLSPYSDLPCFSVVISGTPMVSLLAISASAAGKNIDEVKDMMPQEGIDEAYNAFYNLYPTKLIIHTANPVDENLIANIAHDVDTNGLQVYGEDLQDFCISSVGSLNMPLENLLQPMGPPPGGGVIVDGPREAT